MYQVPGQISLRLLVEHGEESPAWWPPRTAHPYARPAACGWSCGRPYSPAGPESAPSVPASHALDRPGSDLAATAA